MGKCQFRINKYGRRRDSKRETCVALDNYGGGIRFLSHIIGELINNDGLYIVNVNCT